MGRRLHGQTHHHNTGTTAINGWALTFTFPGDQKVTTAWSATVNQNAQQVTATNAGYNATISRAATRPSASGDLDGNDTSPTGFAVNGTTCH